MHQGAVQVRHVAQIVAVVVAVVGHAREHATLRKKKEIENEK